MVELPQAKAGRIIAIIVVIVIVLIIIAIMVLKYAQSIESIQRLNALKTNCTIPPAPTSVVMSDNGSGFDVNWSDTTAGALYNVSLIPSTDANSTVTVNNISDKDLTIDHSELVSSQTYRAVVQSVKICSDGIPNTGTISSIDTSGGITHEPSEFIGTIDPIQIIIPSTISEASNHLVVP